MGYYSIIAIAKQPVAIPDPMVMLDRGMNVFTAQTDDLDGFLATLKNEGVTVQKVNQLDGLDAVKPEDTLLLASEREAAKESGLLGGWARGTEEADT